MTPEALVPAPFPRLARGLIALLLFASAAILVWTDEADAERRGVAVRDAVIVIALDGVRWQEIFDGCEALRSKSGEACSPRDLAPNLMRLAYDDGAVLGAPGYSSFRVDGPSFISLPGYQQLFTGRRSLACETNQCGRVLLPTMAEVVARRFGRDQAAVFSSWAPIAYAASSVPEATFLSTGHAGAGPGYRGDGGTARLALEYAERVNPRLLFVGLGDTDEAAHAGDYEAYLAALRAADEWIGRFGEFAKQREAAGHPTTLFITTDHGRASDFNEHERAVEAAATWLVASGSRIRARGAIDARPHVLADVAPSVAELLGVNLPDAEGVVIRELRQRRRQPLRVALAGR